MTETMAPRTDFPPARRFAYWPWTVFCAGFYGWLLWQFDTFRMLPRESLQQYIDRAGFTLLLWSPFLLAGGLFLFLPLGRRAVRVEADGVIFTPVGRGRPTTLRWETIEKIERRMQHRRPDALWFHLREGGRDGVGTIYKLVEDLYGGTHIELLTAIRETVPQAGFTLKGHRLDIQHWGGEEWWLDPAHTPAS